MARTIFVFGSNLAGRHGKGAALYAKQFFGAQLGVGIGRIGGSYAIPTKDRNLKVLPLTTIEGYVKGFISYAKLNPKLKFQLTAIGTGLAGYKFSQIGPMFKGCPDNVEIPKEFKRFL